MSNKPQTNEYAAPFAKYIDLVPEGDLVSILVEQSEQLVQLLSGVSEEQSHYRYDEGKWSIREVLGHVIDNERVWTYRLLRIARGDQMSFPSYNENQFMANSRFDAIPLSELLDEFVSLRKSAVYLLKGLPAEAWDRAGTLYDHPLTTRAAAAVVAGHEKHHCNIIRERYLPGLK